MIAGILLFLLTGLLALLLFTPMILRIDTANNDYSLRWQCIGRVAVVPDEQELVIIRLKIFFLRNAFTR